MIRLSSVRKVFNAGKPSEVHRPRRRDVDIEAGARSRLSGGPASAPERQPC